MPALCFCAVVSLIVIPDSLIVIPGLTRNLISMGYVYIFTNDYCSVLYIGVTADLIRRIREHSSGERSKFTRKYNCTKLVYYEVYHSIADAIQRETQLKWWHRAWKQQLVEEMNPKWIDLGKGLRSNPLF